MLDELSNICKCSSARPSSNQSVQKLPNVHELWENCDATLYQLRIVADTCWRWVGCPLLPPEHGSYWALLRSQKAMQELSDTVISVQILDTLSAWKESIWTSCRNWFTTNANSIFMTIACKLVSVNSLPETRFRAVQKTVKCELGVVTMVCDSKESLDAYCTYQNLQMRRAGRFSQNYQLITVLAWNYCNDMPCGSSTISLSFLFLLAAVELIKWRRNENLIS